MTVIIFGIWKLFKLVNCCLRLSCALVLVGRVGKRDFRTFCGNKPYTAVHNRQRIIIGLITIVQGTREFSWACDNYERVCVSVKPHTQRMYWSENNTSVPINTSKRLIRQCTINRNVLKITKYTYSTYISYMCVIQCELSENLYFRVL